MRRIPLIVLLCAVLSPLAACESQNPLTKWPDDRYGDLDRELTVGYSLLYDQVTKQQNVDKLLLVKKTSPDTAALLHDIAATCGDVRKTLEDYIREEDVIVLNRPALPKAEAATRRAREEAARKAILSSGGSDMELLLSQVEGLTYAQQLTLFLAKTEAKSKRELGAEEERKPVGEKRAEWFEEQAEKFGSLRARAIELL